MEIPVSVSHCPVCSRELEIFALHGRYAF